MFTVYGAPVTSRVAGAICVAACAVLCGCDDMGAFERAKQEFHYSYSLEPGGRLDFENRNGSVEISGWDRDTIDVSGTKYAPTEAELNEVVIKVDAHGKDADIRTETPSSFMGSWGARYEIRVPRRLEIGRAQTTNGSVTVSDLDGGGRVRSTNGRISLARGRGDYELSTTNGSVELNDCTGNIRVETTNGSVRGSLKEGAVDAHSTNGNINMTLLKPLPDHTLRLTTTNGSITLEMAEFHGNSIDAETTHGTVSLRLPRDTNAKLTAHTSVSKIISDLPLSSTEEMSKHDLHAQLGTGGPLISLRSSTGAIHIAKY